MIIKSFKRIICSFIILSLLTIGIANPICVQAAESNQQMNNYIENYLTSEVEKTIEENGNVVIHITNPEHDINDTLILENNTTHIILNGEIIGYFTPVYYA